MSEIALDIETISPGMDDAGDVDFLDSRDFELLAIGVAHRCSPTSEIKSDVLWRSETRSGDEYKLLCRLIDWMQNRHYDHVLTFNGAHFDERHLRGRAAVLTDELGDLELPAKFHDAWQRGYHRDLMHDVIRDHGGRMSFESAVEEYCGYRPASVSWDGDTVSNGDIPELGEQLLAHRAGLSDMDDKRALQLRDVLETYVRTDIEPLFDLHDALDRR